MTITTITLDRLTTALMVCTASALVALWLAGRSLNTAPVALRPARRWFVAGFAAYAVGQIVWDLQVLSGASAFPAFADAFYLMLGPLLTVGLVCIARDRLPTGPLRIALLDTATLVTAMLTSTLAYFLPRQGTFSNLQMLVMIGYTLSFVTPACLGCILLLALRLKPTVQNFLLPLSLLTITATWATWNLRVLDRSNQNGDWLNLAFSAQTIALAWAASTTHFDTLDEERWQRRCEAALRLLPLLMVALTAVGVVSALTADLLEGPLLQLAIAGGGLVCVLAIFRQSDLLNEHKSLQTTERLLRLREEEVLRSQACLQEEEARYRTLIESAGDSILIWNDGIFSDCNSATLRIFGCSREQFIGHTPWEFSPEFQADGRPSLALAQEKIHAALNGIPQFFEWRHRQYDGTEFDAEVTINRLNSDASRVIAIVRDITERKRTETEIRDQKDLLQATIEASPGLFLVFDADGNIKSWNRLVETLLEFSRDQIQCLHILDLCHPDDKPSASEKIAVMLDRGNMENLELLLVSASGKCIPVLATGSRAMLGGLPHIVAFALDLSIRKLMEKELQEFQLELIQRNDSLRLINFLFSRLNGLIDIQDIATETVGILQTLGRASVSTLYLLTEDRTGLELAASDGMSAEEQLDFFNLPLTNSLSGTVFMQGNILTSNNFTMDPRITPMLHAFCLRHQLTAGAFIPLIFNGNPIGILNVFFEEADALAHLHADTLEAIGKTVSLAITNARHLKDLEHQAQHDSLTNLPNRLVLHDTFDNLCDGGPVIALMLLDLNRFKEVNDTLGHHAGDLLLMQTSQRLSHVAANHSALVCRLGGDEFAILLHGLSHRDEAIVFAQQLSTALRKPFVIEGKNLQISASVGVALFPEHGNDSHALLRAADVAMYRAKHLVSEVVVYDKQTDTYSPERLSIISDLGQAITEKQLVLHYQPKLALDRKTVTGFEALVRWQHPRLGFLYPDAFIPIAEQGEAIHRLTQSVLDMALAQQQLWKRLGYRFSVAVNLSARSLTDDRAVYVISDLMQKYNTQAGELELEITETALMQDPDYAARLLHRIAALGVKLSIDDFGTGYSSLGYLRHLPISSLKIDRLFVKDMLQNEQDAIIVRSTIGLAHNLSLQVIAEGVEDGETCSVLEEMGCDLAQGYYLSKPCSWSEIQEWLLDLHAVARSV